VAGEFATFLETSGEEPARRRVRIEGPDVALSPAAAQSLSMALHELCTNAMKYGALSVPEGRVEVGWVLEEAAGALRLTWRERGGPALAGAPERQGFGSRVLDATIGHQLGGGVERRWEEAGLVCVLRVPLARLAGGRVEPNGALLGAEG
jgi:two-component sensor histidine kinase